MPIEWYEEQCGLVSFNMEVIMREIELKRIHGSSMSPFKRSDLMYLMNHQREAIDKVDYSRNLCPINIYEKIKLNKVYILSVDPSEGLAQDNNAFTLIDPNTQKPVAEFRSPYISQPELSKLICSFLDEYCPKAMIIVENNKGWELINCLRETRYRYQLYYDDSKLGDKVIEKTDPYGALKRESMQRRAFGISTTSSNRSLYYAILENIMEERKDLLLTPYLVEDVCGLIRKPNGRVEAGPGQHDDNIMSYLIGMFVYLHSPYEKLEEYGIRRGASDDLTDYDESGNMTEEGMMKKFKELLPSLPENMRELVSGALNIRNPVDDAVDYHRQLDAARGTNLDIHTQGYSPNETIVPTAAPSDESFWANYDAKIWESNYDDQKFDIEDYL